MTARPDLYVSADVEAEPRAPQSLQQTQGDSVELAEHLRRHLTEPHELVSTSREAKPINRNHFNPYVWRTALEAAGIERTRSSGMHALRHFYASVLIDAGESVRAVARLPRSRRPRLHLARLRPPVPASEDRARSALDRALADDPQGSTTTASNPR